MDKLFEPSRKFIKSTNLYKFQTYLEQKLSKKFLNYNKLWLWTNKNPGEFWESIVEYFNIDLERKRFFKAYKKKSFWNSIFFDNSNLNYYNLIFKNNSSDLAIEFIGENKFSEKIIYSDLNKRINALSNFFRDKGIKKGDVIAELKNRKVIAQFDGVIGKREFSEDIEVSKSSILINLEDTSSIYCDVDIPEIFVPFIKVGLPVDIKFSGYKNKIYKGEVDSFASRISEDTRALATRIKMDNSSGEILPGSFLEISIKYDVRNGLSAPDTSTIVEGENVFIYKVDEKNKVMKTKVTIGDRYLGFVEILDGLNNGDKIVAEGTKKVRPNLTIRPIEKGAKKKQGNSSWGKKDKSKKAEEKKGKFDWLKNIFKKSDKEKK